MAGGCMQRNVSGKVSEDWIIDSLGTNHRKQSEFNYLTIVDDFPQGDTIKRLSIKRRPRAALNNADKSQNGQWHSAESLSTSSSDDTRLLGMLSSTTKERPPLPPQHSASLDGKTLRNDRPAEPAASQVLNESKPQPAARSLPSPRQSTQKALDQEGTNHQTPPRPHPRRRLASFGGVSSPGSLSPFTGISAYNQNNNGNKPPSAEGDSHCGLGTSLGSRGSTGCLKSSPESSGRSTPVASLGPMNLQHVRDQMVVALQKLKELEEQVKLIPILQVKISVLQEEKRQLMSQLKNRTDDEDMIEAVSKRTDNSRRSDTGKIVIGSGGNDPEDIEELDEEIQAVEGTVKGGSLQTCHGNGHVQPGNVGADQTMDRTLSKTQRKGKFVCTDRLGMKKAAGTEGSKGSLGIYMEREAELDAQKLVISALKERICHLEAELRESALQTEMSRLKLELHAAGARNQSDKASSAKTSTDGSTVSQGVGNHTEYRDASTGHIIELRTTGTCCGMPEIKDVGTGPEEPMSDWVVRKRVEAVEKGVGNHVSTSSQGVGTETKLRDVETNTDNLEPEKGQMKRNSVACGDCSVDVVIFEAKDTVSRGTSPNPASRVDQETMASPHTASHHTNTLSSTVSRFTNTGHAFNADSSTNTVRSSTDKHTNTTRAITRTASVGTKFREMRCTPETCTGFLASAFKQTQGTVTKVTKDTGVGFTNVNDNFLVGLKTRNMASGPSHMPDPQKTRSIGVGEGRIQDFSALSSGKSSQKTQQPPQAQWEPELNHYIEKMHRLLKEHGDLLTENWAQHGDRCREQEGLSPRAASTCKVAAREGTESRPPDVQAPASRKLLPPFQLSLEPSKSDKASPEMSREGASDSEVKRMIQMLEQQTCSALQDKSPNVLRSVVKKQNSGQSCSSSRKNMKFLRATAGLVPVSPNKPSAGERLSEEGEKKGRKKIREAIHDAAQSRKVKTVSSRGVKGPSRAHTQQRCKLSDKMFSACQALKTHLNDGTVLSSKEMHDCLQSLQQEWFSVSSQKSADGDTVEDYLSTFRIISQSVLQHIANMADGNGNTALHYSVSHSNFGVVRKLLDAEVCNVDHQNKAGYTPIMLAALSAVDSPEDMRVVQKLFAKGDVNAKASQAGQTALMLAVSHGRTAMVQSLLGRGADVNLQDDEGSTALMCASEHGHVDMVRLLLSQPGCDTTLTDNEESTALSIALEAGHNDIAVLLYAHANFSKGQTGTSGSRISH